MKKNEVIQLTDASRDDVDASLEDFISQANKPPEPPADWSLNTDEVELVE